MSQRRLPAEIYWRRRLLVLALVILLVWLGLRLWPDGDDAEAAAQPTTPTPTATKTPEPQPTDGATQVSLASGSALCDPETIRITPSVPDGQEARDAVDVNLLVSSTSSKPCTFSPDGSDLLVVISAGKTAVWDSTVCKEALLSDPVRLSPGWSTQAPVQWSGRGSGQTCSDKEGYAGAGRYTIKIGTLGGEPGEASFRLKAPPKPEPSPSPDASPTPDDKKKDEAKKDEAKKNDG